MERKYTYLYLALLAAMLAGCREEMPGGFDAGTTATDGDNVITLVTARADGLLTLSLDAPADARTGVWIDLNGDGRRDEGGAEEVAAFNVYRDYKLADGLQTVSIYGGVTYLGCASNQLTGLDLSDNPLLETLNCPINQLASINLAANGRLARLDCSGNRLNGLDLSANGALVSLWCFNNNLASLDLSANTRLDFLDCSGNRLNTLDVSKCGALRRLICYNNELASLDLSQNTALDRLWLFGNRFPTDEAARIAAMLGETRGGDLWISGLPADGPHAAALNAKGWTQH